MTKIAYIGPRNGAQPSSCGQYRPFFEFLYLSQGREKNPISYIVVFLFQKKNSCDKYRNEKNALYLSQDRAEGPKSSHRTEVHIHLGFQESNPAILDEFYFNHVEFVVVSL